MRLKHFRNTIKTTVLAVAILLIGAGLSFAQPQVNLTAGASTVTLPDGSTVPMWGYTCGTATGATCSKLNPAASGWSPVVITVPYAGTSTSLKITLTNSLPGGVHTSLVIVGQLGGGLGTARGTQASPDHSASQANATWPIVGGPSGVSPPPQSDRVRSLAQELATASSADLTWSNLRPGTYLIESGTHPGIQGPMGLYGMLVVTQAPSGTTVGTAYTGVTYNAEVPLLFSEIDAAQNKAVDTAVNTTGFSETAVLGVHFQPNSALTGIAVTNPGSGYTSATSITISGGGGTGATAHADVDTTPTSPTYGQILDIVLDSGGSGFTSLPTVQISGSGTGATAVAGLPQGSDYSKCNGGALACYPPAVNYTPQYFLINGVAFDKTNANGSLFAATAGVDTSNNPVTTGITGNVLVRLVNAGLRMHIPSIVGAQIGAAVSPATQPPSGFSLIAEDGNPLPGIPRVQSEVFMAAGKTYDVMLNVPAASAGALPIFDRQLSLSAAANNRDGGMLAFIGVNGSQPPSSAAALQAAVARNDLYKSVIAGRDLTVSDVGSGVIANDTNVYGVAVVTGPSHGTLTLSSNGTFTYTPDATWSSGTTTDSFVYQATNSNHPQATVTLQAAPLEAAGNITCGPSEYWSNLSTSLTVKNPGILENCSSAAGYPLIVDTAAGKVVAQGGLNLTVDKSGAFIASTTSPGDYTFTFFAQNSQGTDAASSATVTLHFPQPGKLNVKVFDGADKKTPITDYRWVIEEDKTFYVDPNCMQNPQPAGCPATSSNTPIIFGTNFHSSHMPLIAAGCTGPLSCEGGQTQLGVNVVCDVANGDCRPGNNQTPVDPSQVGLCITGKPDPERRCLDPNKRYYISVLPGDAANPFIGGNASAPSNCALGPYNTPGDPTSGLNTNCGHGMGGAPVTPVQVSSSGAQQVTVWTQPSPYPPGKLSVFVFEDDNPLNGEHDAGGGLDILAPNEPGLGGFELTLFDTAGGTGDATGQPTYDMFNMPLTNSLAGTIDPMTGADACPISPLVSNNATKGDGSQKGIIGMIVTCPTYESDGVTLSPLAGQAVINNLYQGRYTVVATPGADRIARGEEWLQTNTLDGQKALDAFIRIGEPAYFQEFGPAGYHVTIGFANPKIINDRATAVCQNADCSHSVSGIVTMGRMTRVPDERTYGSGNRDAYSFTQCYISLGDPDGEDFAFTKCADDGTFTLHNIPSGNWKVTFFDQWNDQIVDGIQVPVAVNGQDVNMGEIAAHQWQTNVYTSTFLDLNGNGVRDDGEPGLPLVATNVRFRDGSFSNFNNTDLDGNAGFNEIFPLFNWYVIETDYSRYKNSGTHVVYDAGGPVDINSSANPNPNGQTTCNLPGVPQCAHSQIAANIARTYEAFPLPPELSVPGAIYCQVADCSTEAGSVVPPALPTPGTYQYGYQDAGHSSSTSSTGRIDPPWVQSEAWQGFVGQSEFLEFGKKPFAAGENGGIRGHVVYASTRPFDDPQMLLQLSWEPLIPHVRINLYQEGTAPDGTKSLKLIDWTTTSSFDDWAQGFRRDPVTGNFIKGPDGNYIPNMNCPGQTTDDPFYYALFNQPSYLDWYESHFNGATLHPISSNAQFKCYDGMHNWNQVQPAPYDGMYQFPSMTGVDPKSGKPTGTNCTACIANPDTDPHWAGLPMLPNGRYVVEVVVPPGYELVKEEDKNILIGDNFIAPVTQQFGGLANVFILPDQATVENTYNAQNPTQSLGRDNSQPTHEADTGSDESYWPCVGTMRVVPDYISLFPGSAEVAPFAGAKRPLCDRKEVALESGMSAQAKFYLFTSTHVASHFTGQITDDFTSEFNPFSPAFGEKFAPAYMPVAVRDWTGNLTQTVYSDQFGVYNGMSYSTWEVNPPNPTGYGPTMMVMCMNDAIIDGGVAPDGHFQPGYSQFCYELPFMPGQTGYFDTPVVGIQAFAEGFNHPDCNYPNGAPAIKSVLNTAAEGALAANSGPWVSAAGSTHKITITALGDQYVENYGYTGPSATASPFNQQKVLRHYGFGSQSAGTQCTTGQSCVALVGSDGVVHPLTNVSWTDGIITGAVPTGLPACPGPQQQLQYGGSPALCGELRITTAAGLQSVDTVTVTIGGKAPVAVIKGENASNNAIQSAIDTAAPGDMIIVGAGTYNEMVLMWKPLRLQGVGAESAIINANTQPAGKLDPWRRQVACLFGIALDGSPRLSSSQPFDPSGTFTCPGAMKYLPAPSANWPTLIVDRIPMEGILGWDTSVNGNLAEQLIEPSIMGAYEGAAISVLGKGVNIPTGTGVDPFGSGATESAFPAGSLLLMGGGTGNGAGIYNAAFGDSNPSCHISSTNTTNPYPSNYMCNPSRIDGLGIQNSSQGGGGIFVHAWGHNIQIANNRIKNNTGTLAGGITIGQGEHTELPVSPTVGNAGTPATNVPPSTCLNSGDPNALGLPYCYNLNVNVHNNSVTLNSSIGDELFSSTPAGPGGVVFCNGADYYNFQYNWVCGNLSSGDGAGFAHIGFSYYGTIQNNTILFNQSTNPTIATNGGGVLIMGAPDPDPLCGSVNDKDCITAPGSIAPGDGVGPGLLINANLIMGNSADSGSGGGIRLQHINGTDVLSHPNGNSSTSWPGLPSDHSHDFQLTSPWNKVRITNNIIANNVAGWDGGGVSLLDALNVDFINNTIVSNDSTASSGSLFSSLFAPLASSAGPCPVAVDPVTGQCPAGAGSTPQPAGLVSINNSAVLAANMQANGLNTFTCPTGHGGVVGATGTACRQFSAPVIENNLIWQNRTFTIGIGALGPGLQNQQFVVKLKNGLSGTLAANQTATGQCLSGADYWDIGVRGDTSPTNHSLGTLTPTFSVLSSGSYTGNSNLALNPEITAQYCNGSRIPPEACGSDLSSASCFANLGWQVPPGTNENNAWPVPQFSLSPAATVDEGNNWINLRWGPLAQSNPVTNAALADFHLLQYSPAINAGTAGSATTATNAPATDYYGNPRSGTVDIGAIEFQGSRSTSPNVYPLSLAFGDVNIGSSATLSVTVFNPTGAPVAVGVSGLPASGFSLAAGGCGANVAANGSCTINVQFTPTTTTAASTTMTVTVGTAFPVSLTGTGVRNVFVSPTSVTFATTRVGGTSAAQTVTLTNSTTVNATGITPTFSSTQFALSGGTCGAAPFSLNAGASCTISMVFKPTALGTQGGFLTIASSNVTIVGSPVSLSGIGGGGSLSPASLNFGLVPTGATSTAQTVTLTNTDPTNALTLTGITVGAPFSRPAGAAGGTCSTATAVAVNGTCTINVVFTPTATGPFTGSLAVTGTYPTGPAPTFNPVALSGSGFSIAPNPLAFGGVLVGRTSATQVITITNPSNSNAPLSITNITQTGNQFTLVNSGATDCGTTFPVNIGGGAKGPDGVTPAPSSCTVGVQFHPTSSGAKAGTVTISIYNPAGTSSFNVGLTGTGTTVTISAPTPALTTSPANTTTKNGVVTVTNNSGAAITFNSDSITKVSGPTGSSFSIVPAATNPCTAGGNIANGSSCNIGVRYNPGGSTNTSSAHVNINFTYSGSHVAQSGANFNAN